ncbi:MAG: hypothetical protein GC129_04515 [Proteobacteria bacterium]|nr:hypothetical protein [Pseudomonadota bacterium]
MQFRRTLFLYLPAALLASCANPMLQSPEVTHINPKTGQVETSGSAKEIEAGLLKAFPDIPIPASHKIDLERSVIFTSPNQTVGKLTTEGSGDVGSIYAFYTQQMQTNGWSLVNSFQSSTSSLYFSKPGRFVAIIIEAASRTTSRVTINVGPE